VQAKIGKDIEESRARVGRDASRRRRIEDHVLGDSWMHSYANAA
jgi:hypothetical protein